MRRNHACSEQGPRVAPPVLHERTADDEVVVIEEQTKGTRVLVVEGVPLFKEGLCRILENAEGCVLVGACSEPSLILTYVQDVLPDVLILDADLVGVNPRDLIPRVCSAVPELALIAMTSSGEEEKLFAFLVAGARAYATKTIAPPDLLALIGAVQRGGYLFGEEVIEEARVRQLRRQEVREAAERREQEQHDASPLSAREREVLELLAQTNGVKEIAAILHVSPETVNRHLATLQQKLSVEDRTAALVKAVRQGWVTLPPTGAE